MSAASRTRTLPVFVRRLNSAFHASMRDAELLTAFATEQDAEAFAALITRHGPLVWGVCRRTLRDTHDAEDAFQATFLILAREAGRLDCRETLSGWLYSVARRVAHNLRRSLARRQEHEKRAAASRPGAAEQPDTDLGKVLDEELAHLPDKLRNPLLLCHLQGMTHAEAAEVLKCPVSTLSERLARGCEILRGRLARRGLVMTGGHISLALATALSAAASPQVEESLVETAVSFAAGVSPATSAARLAVQVAQATVWARLRLGGVLLAAVLGVAGAGTAAHRHSAPARGDAPSESRPLNAATSTARLDRFGDPLPEGAVVRAGTLRLRPGRFSGGPGRFSGYAAVALSKDARTIYTIDGTNEVAVWDLVSGKQVRTWPGPETCVTLALSPDGTRLAAAGIQEVWTWDVTSDGLQPLWKQKPEKLRPACVAFSPDGKTIACGGESEQSIQMFDAATGELRSVLPGRGHKLAFSPDGRTLASWDHLHDQEARNQVCLWDVATGEKRHTLACASDKQTQVSCFAFSQDGKTMATTATDRSIRLWDVATGQERRLAEDAAHETFVVFEPGGRNLIEAGGERIRVWDVATGREARPAVVAPYLAVATDGGNTCRLSADGSLFVSATPTAIGVWEVRTGRPVGPTDVPGDLVDAVAFSPDGSRLVLKTHAGRQCVSQQYDARSGRYQGEFRPATGPDSVFVATQVGFARTQQIVVTGAVFSLPTKETKGFSLAAWCVAGRAGEKAAEGLRVPAPHVNCNLVTSPDGRLLLMGDEQGNVVVRDRDGGRILQTLKADAEGSQLCFSSDGRWVAGFKSGEAKTRLTLWDVSTWRQTGTCEVEHRYPTTFAVAPGGRWVALGSQLAGPLRVWDTTTGKLAWQFGASDSPGPSPANALAFSPDGRMLAAGGEDGIVRLWEVCTGQERLARTGHRARATSVAFSPDGLRLASGSTDSTALIWDLKVTGPSSNRVSLDAAWSVLTGGDAVAAYKALNELVDTPGRTVPMLRERLCRPEPDAEKVQQWIRDLDDPRFGVRETADRELKKLGSAIEPALTKALKDEQSPEVRARLTNLLGRLAPGSAATLGVVRGIELLERMAADPGARKLLDELADAPTENALAREARAARRRLAGG
ncbi:sigma-70 family RNA polymerase sigma factor [Fimbriiglobus ruber]|uniref:High-affnity carbon uptake protein Hat/HatR n=1 Tax=Fimbriiglobus ruber TaxID=1908690 RepID=A0A225DJ40_9BACT|nr:sigma-70 family RNA polymerase sigma factor [Fimbriiglobus ruber]OWK39714.1 High-affnity carbon uptake protein Hat/HatR [Fimbriiglobus ruber]